MVGYASNTGTRRNLDALRVAGWRILLTPDNPTPRPGLSYGLDNGAWGAFQKQQPFDESSFLKLLSASNADADFVVVPDIVAGGERSLDFSLGWMGRLSSVNLPLLAVQDGMSFAVVRAALTQYPRMGIFLGGTTEWKLATMGDWGDVAESMGRYYHVGRVNTMRRIRLCAEAGADSFDGTSATMFSCTLPMLEAARQQPSLLSPERMVSA